MMYGVVPRTPSDRRAIQLFFLASTGKISREDFKTACIDTSREGQLALLWLIRCKAQVLTYPQGDLKVPR